MFVNNNQKAYITCDNSRAMHNGAIVQLTMIDGFAFCDRYH